MKKILLFILALVGMLFVIGCSNKTIKYNMPLTRDVALISKQIDYQSFFNDFTKQEVVLDKNKNTIQFKATKEIDASLFENVDFVNYSTNKNKVEFDYDVKYDANSNEFSLSVTANTQNGKVIDNWKGTPFVDEKGDVDIVFSTDDGIIYLSELEKSSIINEVGWFSRLFRKIAKVAAIVAVVAIVVAVAVVAAPVAAAAGTAFTAAATAGSVVTLTAGSAASAMAIAAGTAVTSTAFVVATTTSLTAGFTAISSYLASTAFKSMEEKVNAAIIELSKTKNGNKGIRLYRGAKNGEAYKSFMPRENIDELGLSFFSSYSGLASTLKGIAKHGVYITTTYAISSTGVFKYRRDSSQHYSVTLNNGTTIGWTTKHANTLVNISLFVRGLN